MTQQDIERSVAEYILQEFLPGAKVDELSPSTPLITGGIIDSLGTLNLVLFLEDKFGIEVEAYEVSMDNMNTTGDIARLVRSKLVTQAA